MTPEQKSAQDLVFLALTLWREARGENRSAKLAVAYVVLTRVALNGWMGHDVLGVTTCPWQFSSMTDPHDPQLTKWPSSSDLSWNECLGVAEAALGASEPNPAPTATHYHDISIGTPKAWGNANPVAQIGRLKFFTLEAG